MTVTEQPLETPPAARGRSRLPILLAVAAALLVILGVYVAGWSSFMGVRTVTVTGSQNLPSDQLIATSGIAAGTPMMRVDLRAAEARLSDLPQVASVDVRREWPRKVVITVTERDVVAMQKSGNGWELLDGNGSPFALAPEKPKDLPIVEVSPDAATNTAMLQALAGMDPQVRAEILSVSAQSPNSIRMRLRGATGIVNWGSADESPFKSQVLAVLLGTEAGWYDVSNPTHPTTAAAEPAPAPAPTETSIPDPMGSPTPMASESPEAGATPSASPAPAESALGVTQTPG